MKPLQSVRNDEREKCIDQMAGKKCRNLTMIILIVSAVIVWYFSIEAFAALCGAVVIIGMVKKGVRLYYFKTLTGTEQ